MRISFGPPHRETIIDSPTVATVTWAGRHQSGVLYVETPRGWQHVMEPNGRIVRGGMWRREPLPAQRAAAERLISAARSELESTAYVDQCIGRCMAWLR